MSDYLYAVIRDLGSQLRKERARADELAKRVPSITDCNDCGEFFHFGHNCTEASA